MSILTKICVVIVAVTSLVAAVLVSKMATTEANWRAVAEQRMSELQTAKASADGLANQLTVLQNQLDQTRDKNRMLQKEYGRDRADLVQEKGDLERELASARAELSIINARLANLEHTAETQGKIIAEQQEQLKASWDREQAAQSELIIARTQLDDAVATSERLDRTVQRVREQLEDLRSQLAEKNKQLQQLQAGEAVQAAAPVEYEAAQPKVVGQISGVSRNLASVNVGSAQGLTEGSRLIIYRGTEFVGHLTVEDVRVNEAAGIITEQTMTPQQGDMVTTRLN